MAACSPLLAFEFEPELTFFDEPMRVNFLKIARVELPSTVELPASGLPPVDDSPLILHLLFRFFSLLLISQIL